MSASLPWHLLIAWILFIGFVNSHQRHAEHFKGSSSVFLLQLNVSALAGTLAGIGILVYYFVQVAWYWPIILLAAGMILAGLLFGLLDRLIGSLTVSITAFTWPAVAIWIVYIIRTLAV